ncbi:hypothetical protein [Paenibacillus radicis (ex Xue et al. 2023)]|uniref:Uncharacterized protein n=1 Tax=Paenibacillus radicis (ex Xue et al. 2023) TaxID=2972489 RepID=A0ABT1YMC3_9BACL|nr:hypothetical protein [Paenibacillus radicis (ex Xue et al. 2023)]MCR8633890.1 hypothetical protein [Paenibacillus radicis (ex Xue et al. 2023)]
MQNICQKIVRVQNGLITEIYDGLMYRDFTDNDTALKELLMDDIGLDFDFILNTYEKLIHDLSVSFPQLQGFINEQLPDGWLVRAEQRYSDTQSLLSPLLMSDKHAKTSQ